MGALGSNNLDSRNKINLFILIPAGAILFGIFSAIAYSWLCDDAFITYRYAHNLVHGNGLVFNVGERVEGYTNFLWTIWSALGLWLNFRAETWGLVWGIIFYAGSLILLLLHDLEIQKEIGGKFLPIAVTIGALHPDWQIYATSGLENSFLTFFLLCSFLMLFRKNDSPVLAGVFAAMATLTRQDAVLFFGVCFLTMLVLRRYDLRRLIYYGAAYSIPCGLFLLWRLNYYFDLFPNTFYAKSGNLTWYSQGFVYVLLYFQKYWVLAAALILPFFIVLITRKLFPADLWKKRIFAETLICTAFCWIYIVYVMRVGGDFMYARLLVPLTPFLAIALEMAFLPLLITRVRLAHILIAIMTIGYVYQANRPMGVLGVNGIVNEWFYYEFLLPNYKKKSVSDAQVLNKYFKGLPVRVGYLGGEARTMYYMADTTAIESETGLTDYFIARQPIYVRGRIGHEKKPPFDYLVNQRKVHFMFGELAEKALNLNQNIPPYPIGFDGVRGRILFWDNALMEELKERGANFVDFLPVLDQYIQNINDFSDERVRKDYRLLKRFYFHQQKDPQRERAFQCRLKLKSCD